MFQDSKYGRIPGPRLVHTGIIVPRDINISFSDTQRTIEFGIFFAVRKPQKDTFVSGDSFGGSFYFDLDAALGKGALQNFSCFFQRAEHGFIHRLFRNNDLVGGVDLPGAAGKQSKKCQCKTE